MQIAGRWLFTALSFCMLVITGVPGMHLPLSGMVTAWKAREQEWRSQVQEEEEEEDPPYE